MSHRSSNFGPATLDKTPVCLHVDALHPSHSIFDGRSICSSCASSSARTCTSSTSSTGSRGGRRTSPCRDCRCAARIQGLGFRVYSTAGMVWIQDFGPRVQVTGAIQAAKKRNRRSRNERKSSCSVLNPYVEWKQSTVASEVAARSHA